MSGAGNVRAGLYERVSKLAGGEDDRSVREQKAANEKACEKYRWRIAERYADPGKSASRFATQARGDYERLLADIKAGRLDILILWEASRGGRELEAWSHLLNACRRHKVKIYITKDDRLYSMSGRDWRSLAEDGVDSAYESEKVSERVRRAMTANAEEGRPHGRVLFGYKRVYDGHRSLVRQEPAPDTSWIPREIISRIAAGEPVTAIMKDLRDRGAPTPAGAPWDQAMVRRIALNPAYIGMRSHQPEGAIEPRLVPTKWWAPIADETDYRDARAVLDSRRAFGPGRAHRHLLTYLASCGTCGGHAVGNKGRAHRLYICKDHGCFTIREDWLDTYVMSRVCHLLDAPAFWDGLLNGEDDAGRNARAEEAGLRQRLRSLRSLAVAGKITGESFAEMEADLAPLIAQAAQRAVRVAVPPHLAAIGPQKDAGALRDILESRPVPVRKEIIRTLYSKVEVMPASSRGRQPGFDRGRVKMTRRGQPDTLRAERRGAGE